MITTTNRNTRRRSKFKEIGLDELDHNGSARSLEAGFEVHARSFELERLARSKNSMDPESDPMKEQSRRFADIMKDLDVHNTPEETSKTVLNLWLAKFGRPAKPVIRATASAPPGSFPSLHRLALIVFLIAVAAPALLGGKGSTNAGTADAGVIPHAELVDNGTALKGRDNSPTDVCTRWSHQSRCWQLSTMGRC